MKIEYKIKGITLDESDLSQICEYYRIASVAQYISDAYGCSDNRAISLANKVRKLMDKYGLSEDQAIGEVISWRTY